MSELDLSSFGPLPDVVGSGPVEKKDVRVRGLFDALLCMVLLYGAYAHTPIGAVLEYGVRTAMGSKNKPSLFSSFRGSDTDVGLDAAVFNNQSLHAVEQLPPAIEDAVKLTRVDGQLLASLVALHGTCDAAGCSVKTPPFLEDLLETDLRGETVPISQVALGIAKGTQRFLSAETASEAMFVAPFVVERAVRQAEASGLDEPEDINVHSNFFPANIRRGPMQDAVQLLALYRMRTMAWPTPAKARVTSPFGYRTHPVLKTRRFHNGTDIGVRTGTPLRSAHKGTIKRAGYDSVSGNYVHINHGFGIVTTHCHMSEIDVKKDQRVARKEIVGNSGATGRVTGPHLHYIVRIDKKAVDPQAYGEAPVRKTPVDLDGKAPTTPKVLQKRGKPDAGPNAGKSDAGPPGKTP